MSNWLPQIGVDGPLQFSAAASEDLLLGARNLRRAFLLKPICTAARGTRLIEVGEADPRVLQIANGFAYRSCVLADGRRAILDILTNHDIVGLDNIIVAHPADEFVAACQLAWRALPASQLRRLMAMDPPLSLHVYALLAEARWRADRLAVSIGRLDAQARICLLLLDIYERLHRRDLIQRPTFNLPLTQEEIGDHLGLTVVHVNRTLRKLREEKLVIVERQVVIIRDLDGLREAAQGLAQFPELAEQPANTAAAHDGN